MIDVIFTIIFKSSIVLQTVGQSADLPILWHCEKVQLYKPTWGSNLIRVRISGPDLIIMVFHQYLIRFWSVWFAYDQYLFRFWSVFDPILISSLSYLGVFHQISISIWCVFDWYLIRFWFVFDICRFWSAVYHIWSVFDTNFASFATVAQNAPLPNPSKCPHKNQIFWRKTLKYNGIIFFCIFWFILLLLEGIFWLKNRKIY